MMMVPLLLLLPGEFFKLLLLLQCFLVLLFFQDCLLINYSSLLSIQTDGPSSGIVISGGDIFE
jgi:hypothetical protein